MMPNVTRGSNMRGLLAYLAGPGRANEHTEPHLVAGDSAVMAWFSDDELSPAAALAVGRTLDHPRASLGVEVGGGDVWHCSLSLRPEEGQIGDQRWAAIAQDLVDGMGFSGAAGTADEGRAPCRWVAVHHGASKGGNDHIHIAVSLVREDGTKARVSHDFWRVQKLANQLEHKHGLDVLQSRELDRGTRGVKPAELQRAKREGAEEPARVLLERQVRAAATAAVDEAEFVRRLRGDGALVRPRLATGTSDVVVGFSVAMKPTAADRAAGRGPVWFGGGRLAQDLTLPRLREAWPDSPAAASAAAAEWVAAGRGRPPAAPGRELVELTAADWAAVTADVRDLREYLRGVQPGDTATWTRVSAETAGAFAAWSRQTETTPGPLAAAAKVLGASAQVRRPTYRSSGPTARGAALLLASIGHGGAGPVATAALFRQLANTSKAIHDAHLAAGDLRRAAEIEAVVRTQLEQVRRQLPEPAAVTVRAPSAPVRAVGPVLPSAPAPSRLPGRASTTAPGAGRDREAPTR
ncbi:hypothetical protein SAMN03159343_4100 [Klenkia marina]|uniref:MobA/VirD2-like nuclease domain-containing protein n=1 Tax=Klenkia marina TaxID=1960309 RepID=A0A1G4Z477_9ACTN|nr:hypothetical protein SAMN03159343_4100 [Klenkia marina]